MGKAIAVDVSVIKGQVQDRLTETWDSILLSTKISLYYKYRTDSQEHGTAFDCQLR